MVSTTAHGVNIQEVSVKYLLSVYQVCSKSSADC